MVDALPFIVCHTWCHYVTCLCDMSHCHLKVSLTFPIFVFVSMLWEPMPWQPRFPWTIILYWWSHSHVLDMHAHICALCMLYHVACDVHAHVTSMRFTTYNPHFDLILLSTQVSYMTCVCHTHVTMHMPYKFNYATTYLCIYSAQVLVTSCLYMYNA